MWYLRQSTAGQEIPLGPFLDSTDGNTAETGLSVANTDIKLQKTGATSEVSKNSGGATHIAGGRFYAVLDATDSDTIGPMRVSVHVAGALAVWLDCCVLDETVYDVLFGTVALATVSNITSAAGCAVTSIANNAITAASAAADFGAEIQALITGGAYALSTDANGRVRIVDGTGTGEIDTASGKVSIVSGDITSIQSGLATSSALSTVAGNVSTILGVTNKIDTAMELDGSVYRFTTNALEQAPSGGGGSTDWTADERTAIRAILGIPGSGTTPADPTSGILDTIRDYLDTEIATIITRIGVPSSSLAADLAALNDISAADVWASGARVLTAGTNIVLAKGVGVTGFNDLSAANVNAEVVDALATDTYAEPGQGAPGVTLSLAAKLAWLYTSWRNKKDNNGTETKLYADDGTTVLAKQGTTSSSGTVTKAEWITGA